MLAIRLPVNIEKRLSALAKKTGRTKTFYAREAILNYLDDLESIYTSLKRLDKPKKRYSLEEIESVIRPRLTELMRHTKKEEK